MKKMILSGLLLSLSWAVGAVAEVQYDAAIPQVAFAVEKVTDACA